MAWGRIYKKGKSWHTDIIFQGRRRREKIGKKEDAQKVLNQKLSELTLEEHGIIENEKVTLKDFAPEYLIHKKNSTQGSTYSRVEIAVNVHLIPYFGKEFLFNITPHKISATKAKGFPRASVTPRSTGK